MSSSDYAVVLLYAAVLLWIGWRAGVSHPAASELTLGSRQIPTWAVLCSMSATELSAATFLGVPHAAYEGDWFYLQLALGALLGKPFSAGPARASACGFSTSTPSSPLRMVAPWAWPWSAPSS